jgi:hypothetical protein
LYRIVPGRLLHANSQIIFLTMPKGLTFMLRDSCGSLMLPLLRSHRKNAAFVGFVRDRQAVWRYNYEASKFNQSALSELRIISSSRKSKSRLSERPKTETKRQSGQSQTRSRGHP